MKTSANKETELTGGESVYCVNRFQLEEAQRLIADADSGPRITTWLGRLELELTRNEQAALAFELIDRLARTHGQ